MTRAQSVAQHSKILQAFNHVGIGSAETAFRDGNSIQKHQGKDRQNVQCAGEHLSPYQR